MKALLAKEETKKALHAAMHSEVTPSWKTSIVETRWKGPLISTGTALSRFRYSGRFFYAATAIRERSSPLFPISVARDSSDTNEGKEHE
jgi:hypothetical protein